MAGVYGLVLVKKYPMLPTIPDVKKSMKNRRFPILFSRLEPKKNNAIILKNRCSKFACRNIDVINIQGASNAKAGKKAR